MKNQNILKRGIFVSQYRINLIKEIVRKSIHLCSAFIPFFLEKAYIPTLSLLFLALLVYSVSEFIRYKGKEVPFVSKLTAVAARKRDENKFVLGPVTLVIGIICSALLWNPTACCIGIYALAFGDGFASLSGKLIGRISIPFSKGKTAAGSLTCFAAIFISSFLVCNNTFIAFFLAFTGMIIEVIPMTDFDNIVLPVLIGGLAHYLIH